MAIKPDCLFSNFFPLVNKKSVQNCLLWNLITFPQSLGLTQTRLLPWWEHTPLVRSANTFCCFCSSYFFASKTVFKLWNWITDEGREQWTPGSLDGGPGKWFQQPILQGHKNGWVILIKPKKTQRCLIEISSTQDLVDPSISWNHRAISTKIQWNAPGIAFMLNIDVALYIDIQVPTS